MLIISKFLKGWKGSKQRKPSNAVSYYQFEKAGKGKSRENHVLPLANTVCKNWKGKEQRNPRIVVR